MLPAPGNHDHLPSYFTHFASNPWVNQNGKQLGYYSLLFPENEKDAWQLIGLNLYSSERQAQLEWLKNKLEWPKNKPEAPNSLPWSRCVLAFSHLFFYSSGLHGHNQGYKNHPYDPKPPPVPLEEMKKIYPLLHQYQVSILLAGHDHDFEVLRPTNAASEEVADGVRSFVVGTGGAGLYTKKHNQIWKFSDVPPSPSYGILKIELFSDRYHWDFIPAPVKDNPMPHLPTNRTHACQRPKQ